MTSGTPYEQRDILLIPFPFTDLSAVKKRPVLVLSKDIDNRSTEDLITCGITSHISDRAHSVLISEKNLEDGALPIESSIKVDKLFTVERSIVIKKLGKLDTRSFEKVKAIFFDLV